MKSEDFIENFTKLMKFYGKTLDKNQIEFWADRFSGYEYLDLKKAVEHICNNSKTFPTPSDLHECLRNQKSTVGQGVSMGFCEKCGYTGFISATKDNKNFAFRCLCENGDKLSKVIPLWNDSLGSDVYVNRGIIHVR